MMMGFGGMINAGAMGGMQGNPYMLQQQQLAMQQQQQPRVGVSQFPPPVTESGNIYDPKKPEKEGFFKMPTLSMPNADWGEVAYGASVGLGAGAIVGTGAGLMENYRNAPEKGYEYDIKTGVDNQVTHRQQITARPEASNMVAKSHITGVEGNKLNASIDFNYRNQALLQNVPLVKHLPFTGQNKANQIERINFNVENGVNGTVEAVLQREGVLTNEYRLTMGEGKPQVVYKQDAAGKFIPKQVSINGKIHNFEGWLFKSVDLDAANYTLSKMLGGVPEEAIRSKMPPTSLGRQLPGKTSVNWTGGRLSGLVTAGAAVAALAAGGYQAWKTSQPKSAEERLKSLPPQGMLPPPTNPPQQQRMLPPQQG